ncbi:MAG TPA: hypothetical protein VFG21_07360 [Xanthomonadaceae bacterium]|nr:hypothetical protein [Xanthomonadaceae bacterium]
MSRALYIASTPLIALEAAGAALAQPGTRAWLLLLRDFDRAAEFATLLRGWRDLPFERIEVLPGRMTEAQEGAGDHPRGIAAALHRARVKRALRAQTLALMRAIDAGLAPGAVWVGNDRKVETQLALHLASERTGTRAGRYLDDGLYTYLGDVRERPLVRRIDWLVKQLAYGRWWQRARRAGTTSWIDSAYLAYPALAPHANAVALPREWFLRRAFVRLALHAARSFRLDRGRLARVGAVLVLPHSNQLRSDPEASATLRALVAELGGGRALAVKYHPRETESDPGGLLGSAQTIQLPSLLPMELLLPLLPAGIRLLGEGSTALMAAHWLRPDLAVCDLGLSRHPYAVRARALFDRLGIVPMRASAPARASPGQSAYS